MKQPKLTSDGIIVYCPCGNVHDITVEYDDTDKPVKVADEVTFRKEEKVDEGQEGKEGKEGKGGKPPIVKPKRRGILH